MFRPIRLADNSRTGTETGTNDISYERARKHKTFTRNDIYNDFKSMNRRHNKDREEFRTFRKEYEIDRKERKESNDTSFREDIRSS